MRSLDIRVKQEFIRKEAQMEKSAEKSATSFSGTGIFGKRPQTSYGAKSEIRPKSNEGDKSPPASPAKKTRPRSRTLVGTTKGDLATASIAPSSPKKKNFEMGPPPEKSLRVKGAIFPPASTAAIASSGPISPVMVGTLIPEEWVDWLEVAGVPKNMGNKVFAEEIDGKGPTGSGESGMKDVEIAALHKLRLVLRNERLKWVEKFIELDGMQAVWGVVERVLGVEWRYTSLPILLNEKLFSFLWGINLFR